MKKFLALALVSALPVVAMAQQSAAPAAKPVEVAKSAPAAAPAPKAVEATTRKSAKKAHKKSSHKATTTETKPAEAHKK